MCSRPEDLLNYKFLQGFQENNIGHNIRFVAYAGTSMNPTLREPELMEVMPYQDRSICRGDVVYFKQQDESIVVVHRVVKITRQGVITRGDNNQTVDSRVLPYERVIGKVTAVWIGSKRRLLWGGWQGHLLGMARHGLNRLNIPFSRYFGPVYGWLCKRRIFSSMLPQSLQPRIIHFDDCGQARVYLFWGDMMIGWYMTARCQWIIRRPFRLIVDEDLLKKYPNKMELVESETEV